MPPPPPAHSWASLASPKSLLMALFLVTGTLGYRLLEKLGWVDALYLSTCVVTCVGMVIVPVTPQGRLFTALLNAASLGAGVLWLLEVAEVRREGWRRALWWGGVGKETASMAAAAVPSVLGFAAALRVLEPKVFTSLPEAAYFALTVSTGLGMGDVEPKRKATKLLLVVYVLATLGVVMNLLGSLANGAHEWMRKVQARASGKVAPPPVVEEDREHYNQCGGGG